MGEEIAFEKGLVTLTLDRVILHTVMHQSSTSTYIPYFIEIEETLCGQTNVRTDGHLRPAFQEKEVKLTAGGRVGFVKDAGFKLTVEDAGSNGSAE